MRSPLRLTSLASLLLLATLALTGCSSNEGDGGKMGGAMEKGKMEGGDMEKGKMDGSPK
jgi:hypothetical protein